MECRQGTGGPVECREHRWDREVYYRYTFSAPAAGQAALRLTAVDEHEVFLNGSSLGAGAGGWTTVEEYGLTLERGENDLAVRVVDRGRRGNGLIAEILVAENDVRVSRPGGLNLWRWTGSPQRGSSWQTADVSEDPAWKPVQLGYLDGGEPPAGIGDSGAEVIAGFPGGVDTGRPQGGMDSAHHPGGEHRPRSFIEHARRFRRTGRYLLENHPAATQRIRRSRPVEPGA